MKVIYDQVSVNISKKITRTYSTSFSLGIYFLSARIREDIYAIYGYVRLADEIVDSFCGFDRATLLDKFKRDTHEAIASGISCNPVIHAFQQVVRKYKIDHYLIDTFLDSMYMDLEKVEYTVEKYRQYILGSAEIVGLMCLQVFTEGDVQRYEALKPYAMKLGAAFQKVNFLRDVRDDYYTLGRTYFPDLQMEAFSPEAKIRIEEEIEKDFEAALEGIKQLPDTCKGGVYLAYFYYRSLFKKIRKLSPQRILHERVRINNGKKFVLLLNSFFNVKMNWV